MRFGFVKEHGASFSAARLCEDVGVTARVLQAFPNCTANCRQGSDLATLAHIKEQSRLSLGRLMHRSGISVVRARKHKLTTD
ncbi:transposase, partial [Salipiger aestuarii]